MEPSNEHAFYAWLIIIAAVCIVVLIGAAIDRYFLNRRLKRLTARQADKPSPDTAVRH